MTAATSLTFQVQEIWKLYIYTTKFLATESDSAPLSWGLHRFLTLLLKFQSINKIRIGKIGHDSQC